MNVTRLAKRRSRMRGKSVVWDHFNCEDEDGQGSSPTGGKCRPSAYCSYCNLKYTFPNATKMMRHLLKCTQCPDATKRELEQSGFGEYRVDHNGTSMNNTHDEDLHPSTSMVPQMVSPVFVENESPTPGTSALSPRSGFLVVPNPLLRNDPQEIRSGRGSGDSNIMDDQEQISPTDRVLARAIFCTDVPLDILKNVHWQELFRHLQPAYTLPSKELLTGRLLDDEYMATREKVSAEISKTKFVGLLAHNESEARLNCDRPINLIITTPRPMFICCVEASQQQSPAVMAEVVSDVIAKASPAQVLLITTDVTNILHNARSIIQSRFPLITMSGCPIKGLLMIPRTLLAQDSMRGMVKDALKVCELWNRLVQNDDTLNHIQLPCSGSEEKEMWRTNEVMFTLESLRECKVKLQEYLIAQTVSVESETKEIIMKKSFWDKVNLSVHVWHTVHLAISKLEQETVRLSDVVIETMKADKSLEDALGDSCLKANEIVPILQQSHEVTLSCGTDLHYAACLVDPRYCGTCLSEGAINNGIQYIVELAKHLGQDVGRVLASLAEFRAKEGRLWSQEYVWDAASHVAPATWWKGICDRQPLSQIASGILNLSVTSSMSKLVAYPRGENVSREHSQKIMFVRANKEVMSLTNHHPDMIMVPGGY